MIPHIIKIFYKKYIIIHDVTMAEYYSVYTCSIKSVILTVVKFQHNFHKSFAVTALFPALLDYVTISSLNYDVC